MLYKRFLFKSNFVYEMGVITTVVTIILVPKFQPIVSDYVESEFINSLGLGIAIFVITLFIIIIFGKAVDRAATWTGVGPIDKSFGLLFGVFKGYGVRMYIFNIKLVLSL